MSVRPQVAPSMHRLPWRVVDETRDQVVLAAEVRAGTVPSLIDHRIFGIPIFPAVSYLETALSSAQRIAEVEGCALQEVSFRDLLVAPDDAERQVRVRIRRTAETRFAFTVESAPPSSTTVSTFRRHADGVINLQPEEAVIPSAEPGFPRSDDVSSDTVSGDEFYARSRAGPFAWGETHRVVQTVSPTGRGFVCRLGLTGNAAWGDEAVVLHPALIDGGLQVAVVELMSALGVADVVFVPSRIAEFRSWPSKTGTVWAEGRWSVRPSESGESELESIVFRDEARRTVAVLSGVGFRSIRRETLTTLFGASERDSPARPRTVASETLRGTERPGLLARLRTAGPSERHAVLAAFIEDNVHELLKLDSVSPEELRRGFFAVGLDSLLAIELQYRIQKALDFTLPPSEGFRMETVEELVGYLLENVLSLGASAAPAIAES